MDIKYYEEIWASSGFKDLHSQQILWDSRAEEFNKSFLKKENRKRTNDLINFLVSKCSLNKEGEILDIGCGPGKYSLEFSKLCENVTGIDISSEMIKYAKVNAEEQNVKNIDFQLMPWENISIEEKGWERKYDLVFASMCPGINSKDALIKMVQASKGYCFISSFAKRNDKVMDELYEKVYGEEHSSRWGKNIYCAFNILWNLGFYPEICYHDMKSDKVYPLEKAIELYTLQIQRGREKSKDIKDKVTEYLTSISEDGIIKDTMEAKIAWIYWKA